MFRIEWHTSDSRLERFFSSKDEAAIAFNYLLFRDGVVKVLAYERYGVGEQTGWRLLKVGSDGEVVHQVDE